MGARRTARERALQALYQMEMTPGSIHDALEAAWAAAEVTNKEPEAVKFARELTEGVMAHRAEIDRLIEQHSHNWRLDRMSRIDRNVLRLGVFELKYRPDIPKKVSLNEAVELGKNFGTEESSAFVNGLLDRVAVAPGEAVNVSAHELGLGGLDSLADVDALCLFVGEDDRPLPGTAGYVDWRLCGALSRVLQSGFFVGAQDDSLLLPTDGRFGVPRVFVMGLGRRRGLEPSSLGEALASAGKVLTRAKVESVALEVPGQDALDESVRFSALQEHFLPAFRGRKVAVLADKELARRLSGRKG